MDIEGVGFALIIGFLISWGLGLTPPLLIRYVFVRKPLSKKTATWIAVSFSVFFWMAFRYVNYVHGERPGSGFVWILIFFVARWIMSNGYVPPAEEKESEQPESEISKIITKIKPLSECQDITAEDLAELRSKTYSNADDILNYAYVTDSEWVCVCGTSNVLELKEVKQNCNKCGRDRDFVLKVFTKQ